ncbi:MAG TPA: alanine racemase [Anaerolineae bacterium]|nr:alanine racemase [Anaerolineae bacterium]
MKKNDLPTPCLVVDLDKLQRNIDEMARRARQAGMALRPHVKTHKTPAIAHLQMKAGAVGITCAKLGEAEVMASAGIEDIFVAYPIVGADKVERLLNLALWVPRVSTSVDTLPAARALNAAAIARRQHLDVVAEVDTGYCRTGVAPGEPLLRLVQELTSMPGLRFKGLMYMAANTARHLEPEKQLAAEQASARLATDSATLLREHGIESEVVGGGGTVGARYLGQLPGVTEFRAGCYVFGDLQYADLGAHTREQISLTVLSTVVSVPAVEEPDHLVVDAGSKALTHCPSVTTPGHGTLAAYPDLHITSASEEHGSIRLPPGVRPPALGSKVDIWPNYVSDTVNLFERMWVIQNDEVVAGWDIAARGKSV